MKKKTGISKPKPPVGLEFELTAPFLEANPDVKEAMPPAAPVKEEPIEKPPSPVPEIRQVAPAFRPTSIYQERLAEEIRKREAEAFLWGAASALLVCGTVAFLIWTLSSAPSPPPPGPA
jgi:hypothetical protein